MTEIIKLLEEKREKLIVFNQKYDPKIQYQINKLTNAINSLCCIEKKYNKDDYSDTESELEKMRDNIKKDDGIDKDNIAWSRKVRLTNEDFKDLYFRLFNKNIPKGFISKFCDKYNLKTGNGSCAYIDKHGFPESKTSRYIEGIKIKKENKS